MKINLLRSIKSNQFALWVAILSVVVQSFHSYTAFYNTSSLQGTSWGVAQAILFSVVIDLAILFYTVRNRKDIAIWAALVMVVINSYYYWQHWGASFEFIFGVFLSLIIPTSVYFYSEEIKDEEEIGNELLAAQVYKNEQLEFQSDHLQIANKKLHEALDKMQAEYNEMVRLRQSESMTRQAHDRNFKADKSKDVKITSTTLD